MKKITVHQWVIIGILSCSVAFLNIIRVVLGIFQTPKNSVYLAIGHSYLDYLEYTQQIAQGIYGHTAILNQFTTHDTTQTLLGWGQYLLIGYVARFFHASPFFAYWSAVFIFSVIVLSVTFMLIRTILNRQPFFYQLTAFLFSIFAVPFVTFSGTLGNLTVKPIEFFYSPISIFHRIGGVPHHLTTTICISLCLLLANHILHSAKEMKKKWLYPNIVFFILLCFGVLTFAPLQIFILLSTICTITFGYAVWFWVKEKKPDRSVPFFVFLILIIVTLIPAALYIQKIHGSQELFLRAVIWERTQQYHATLFELLGTIGPILLFVPFGIRAYFTSVTPLKLLLITYVGFSYFYFSTDCAYFFGTFNQRFLTPLSYTFFSITAVLGIQNVTRFFPHKRLLSTGIITLYILYFLTITIIILRSFGGSNELGYMPNDFFTAVRVLNSKNDRKAVLTSSYNNLGILVPSIVDRNVYLGRIIFTPDYTSKQNISDQFYVGNMNPDDAYRFLKENNIGYILVSSMEPYPKENILKYPFITELYQNSFLTILQFHE